MTEVLHEIFYRSQFKKYYATLCVVTTEKAELKFLIILYFYDDNYFRKKAAT